MSFEVLLHFHNIPLFYNMFKSVCVHSEFIQSDIVFMIVYFDPSEYDFMIYADSPLYL
jgi:hypothetical protein